MKGINKTIFRKAILWLFQTRFWSWLLLRVIPHIRFRLGRKSCLPGWKYIRGYRHLEAGNFILVDDKWKLTSLLIPGWPHAALCINKGGEFETAEMTHTAFTESTFYDICQQATRVSIYECTKWDLDYIYQILIPTYLSFRGTPFDVKFAKGTKALACSESIYEADKERRMGASDEDILGLGILYVSPTGLSKATYVRCKWDSDNEIRDMD